MGQTPETILLRLDELRRYQDEQQQLLLEKQNAQRELLEMEQQRLYEMFGLSNADDDSTVGSLMESCSTQTLNSPLITRMPQPHPTPPPDKQSDKQPAMTTDLLDEPAKPSKPFLKRGQGLKERFKIDPLQLRLDNLPTYKFAGAHRKRNAIKRNRKRSSTESAPQEQQQQQQQRQQLPMVSYCERTAATLNDSQSTRDFEELEKKEDSLYCPLIDDFQGIYFNFFLFFLIIILFFYRALRKRELQTIYATKYMG